MTRQAQDKQMRQMPTDQLLPWGFGWSRSGCGLVDWSEERGRQPALSLEAAVQEALKAYEEYEMPLSRTSGARLLPEGRSRVGSSVP